MKTSFDPSSLSIKILAVIPEVDLFAIVIPITIVSRADEPLAELYINLYLMYLHLVHKIV